MSEPDRRVDPATMRPNAATWGPLAIQRLSRVSAMAAIIGSSIAGRAKGR